MNDETRTLLLYLRQCLTFNRRAMRIIDRHPDNAADAIRDWVENKLWVWLLSQDKGYVIIMDVGELALVNWEEVARGLRETQ